MAAILNQKQRVLLHGTLDLWIFEAKCLPVTDPIAANYKSCVNACKTLCLQPTAPTYAGDAYVVVVLEGATLARSQVIKNKEHPVWQEHFVCPVCHMSEELIFKLKDDETFGAQEVGEVAIPAKGLARSRSVEGWFDILNGAGRIVNDDAQLRIRVHFLPLPPETGVGAGPEYHGVQRAYFPLRKGCKLGLFQDAHCEAGQLPDIPLENGKTFQHRKCWEEICEALICAQHMIYIAGWSIYHKLRLRRSPGQDLSLGDLLKKKSAEGIRVRLLVWNDVTSLQHSRVKGVMGTHDEGTRKFFKGTDVVCKLSSRIPDFQLSWFRRQVVGTFYTHHQKTVLVDCPHPNSDQFHLVAFLGGLDLCDGRFDTPDHHLFKNLNSAFSGDFRQPNFACEAEMGGPRMPWHDLHCKIEGPAVYDVLTNFDQRWGLACSAFPVVGDSKLYIIPESDPESWHVQIFRSIDSGSVQGFPKNHLQAEKQRLVCGKMGCIDLSIVTAYVEIIRRAQHFIYIENQYFLGSSYNWPDYKKARANHVIPMELALKIANKIKAGERFAVYVVMPMWPEGAPTSVAVQEILYFQSQTMKMMYTIIAKALKLKGLHEKKKPQDYLLFFCLGAREKARPGSPVPAKPAKDPIHLNVQQTRRTMIYVHSKGIVVDDEYVLLGSANINQRSMSGNRDTEIAMGAYQPFHTWGKKGRHPSGQVYGFRLSMWAEHAGRLEPCFADPKSEECARKMKSIGDENWAKYVSETVTDMTSHLMTYPLKVEDDGNVRPIPGHQTFPDIGGSIIGCRSLNLPDGLTA